MLSFLSMRDGSLDGFSVEKAHYLASKIEQQAQTNGFVACHVDAFTLVSKHLPQFWGLFSIILHHYSNFDGAFNRFCQVELASHSFKFLNQIIIEFSDIISFYNHTNKDAHNLIQMWLGFDISLN